LFNYSSVTIKRRFIFKSPNQQQGETFKKKSTNTCDIKKLDRGQWADCLENRIELPVGGSRIGKDLTITLTLDFMKN